MKDEVKLIPIAEIRILNPRYRDKRKFAVIVRSILNLGLKKPIQVSRRGKDEPEGAGYDLVCGQGRLEAFKALGFSEIPAIIVEVTKEERLLRSLVENMARRFQNSLALIKEINRLKAQGHSNVQIGKKLDITDVTVGGYLALSKAGEERLLDAAISGRIPLTVAMDIAKADTLELQRSLLKAYETNQLNYLSIRKVKRLMDQRRFIGKKLGPRTGPQRSRTSVESLVSAYRRESNKQRLMVKKARVCDAKLVFIVSAFHRLLADENFVTLLRAEGVSTMPKYLRDKINPSEAMCMK
jgi:ParB family chromosome partitioning protein